MNERFAVEPGACDSWMELKFLLEKFGPETGRYLAKFPSAQWLALVEDHFKNAGEMALKRVEVLLETAETRRALIHGGGLEFADYANWLGHIRAVQKTPRRFDGVVVSRANQGDFPSLEEISLPPTAERNVLAKAAEYGKVSEILLHLSSEIHFIDPYMAPCKTDCGNVLKAMLEVAVKGKCQQAYLWLRARSEGRASWTSADNRSRLQAIARAASFTAPRKLFMRIFTDAVGETFVHDRYLLSIHGAIRFEHGFKELTRRRLAKVSPECKTVHDDLVSKYIDQQHDMLVEEFEIDVKVPR